MAKDKNDTATNDLLNKRRGGFRPNSGRKKGKDKPRKQAPWRVSEEAIKAVTDAAKETGHSEGNILNWAMKNMKKIPNKLD